MAKVVLAYSGGLDTSVILAWLREEHGYEVVAYCADVGQGEDLAEVKRKAMATGAVDCIVDDLRTEFVRDFCLPMLRANAIYEGTYLLGTSIARPVIAKGLVDATRRTDAVAISHGATGKGNDQVRFELTALALEPGLRIVAPWREWNLRSRSDCIAYAKERRIPIEVTAEKPYSMDANLFHISYEGGVLEDPWNEPDDGMFRWTTAPEQAPDDAEYVTVGYEQGNPVTVDGDRLTPAELLLRLNERGSRHGVGRVDIVENRFVGMKSRGVYETPGGAILHFAHRQIESITMDREVMHLRDSLIPKYSELVYNGFWYAPERLALQALVSESQKHVRGTVRLKLYKGNIMTAGRRSPVSLYQPEIATMEADPTQAYNQDDATGFIRLNGLRLKVASQVHSRNKAQPDRPTRRRKRSNP